MFFAVVLPGGLKQWRKRLSPGRLTLCLSDQILADLNRDRRIAIFLCMLGDCVVRFIGNGIGLVIADDPAMLSVQLRQQCLRIGRQAVIQQADMPGTRYVQIYRRETVHRDNTGCLPAQTTLRQDPADLFMVRVKISC